MDNLNRFIFQKNIMQKYASEFQRYMIQILYGDIILGSDIIHDSKEEDE